MAKLTDAEYLRQRARASRKGGFYRARHLRAQLPSANGRVL